MGVSASSNNSDPSGGNNKARMSKPNDLLKPLKHPNLILEVLGGHDEVWRKVLDALSTKDLLNFMMTSTSSHRKVIDYISHYVHSNNRLQNLILLLNDAEFPLLPQEKALMLKLKKGQDRISLVTLKGVNMLCQQEALRRQHVYDASEFPWLEDGHQYIKKKFNEKLNRDVVELNNVCWLKFVCKFDDVGPGNYEVSLRVSLLLSFSWPKPSEFGVQDFPTQLKIFSKSGSDDSCQLISCQNIKPQTWEKLRAKSKLAKSEIKPCSIEYDAFKWGSNWFWMKLPPFYLSESSQVIFEFADIENPFWKSGMSWDFVQLKRC